MTENERNTTNGAVWQDAHSSIRGHALMTREAGATIPSIGSTDNAPDYDGVIAHVKLFSPYVGWRWYITEWNPRTGRCFGLVEGFETEIGYFDLTELSEVTIYGSVPAVERDLYWQPMTIGEIRNQAREAA